MPLEKEEKNTTQQEWPVVHHILVLMLVDHTYFMFDFPLRQQFFIFTYVNRPSDL